MAQNFHDVILIKNLHDNCYEINFNIITVDQKQDSTIIRAISPDTIERLCRKFHVTELNKTQIESLERDCTSTINYHYYEKLDKFNEEIENNFKKDYLEKMQAYANSLYLDDRFLQFGQKEYENFQDQLKNTAKE